MITRNFFPRWTLAALFIALLTLAGCSDDTEARFPALPNPPFPQRTDSLRVLALGNSFTDDALALMPILVDSAHLNHSRMCFYAAVKVSASIDYWMQTITANDSLVLRCYLAGARMQARGPLQRILAQPWDVIVVQQASDLSYRWATYAQFSAYIHTIRALCPNPRLSILFQQVWSHNRDEDPMAYRGNVVCSQYVGQMIGAHHIIPTGMAIQYARATHLCDDRYLTRDGWHLNLGIGRYIATATWYERIIRPVFGQPLPALTALPDGHYTEADIITANDCVQRACTTAL